MGYSTSKKSIHEMVHLAKEKHYRVTECTHNENVDYFKWKPWYGGREIVKAELTDHDKPRIIFTLVSGEFIQMEQD